MFFLKKLTLLGLLIAVILSGCTKKETIYYWDTYQVDLYNYYKPEKSTFENQILSLQKIIKKAGLVNKPVPPGLYAHLGLLYLNTGSADKALEQLHLEKRLYPESEKFVEFVEQKIQENSK